VCVSILGLVRRLANRIFLHRVMSSFAGCSAVLYFSTLSHKRKEFRKQGIEHDMCVLILPANLSAKFLILRII
jgi:hypothetical protein